MIQGKLTEAFEPMISDVELMTEPLISDEELKSDSLISDVEFSIVATASKT